MSGSDILIIIGVICFFIGAVKALLGEPISKIGWLEAGLGFVALSLIVK